MTETNGTQPEKKLQTLSEVIKEAELEVNGQYNTHEENQILNTIKVMIDELNGFSTNGKLFKDYTVQELSIYSGRLSVIRASLNEMRVACYKKIKAAKASVVASKAGLRYTVTNTLSEQAKSQGGKQPVKDRVEAEIERQLIRKEMLVSLHEAQYEKLQGFWYSIPTIIQSISVRINYLNGDGSTSREYNNSYEEIPDMGSAIDFSSAMED